MTGILVIILTLLLILLLFINILAEEAIKADIQTGLTDEIRQNSRYVAYDNGHIEVSEDFIVEEDGMYFVILSRSGETYAGSYPPEIDKEAALASLPEKSDIVSGELVAFSLDGEEYYLLDRISAKLTKAMGRTIFIRCIVKKDNINSKYQMIKHISYISILVVLLVSCLFSFILAKKFSEPIKRLCMVAENISCDDDLSKRIDYTGRFREIAILSDTNNRMLEKLEKMFKRQKQFNSDVAHELRNPMAIILAQCEYAKEHSVDPENFEEIIDIIYRQTKKANDIVYQLLKLSRLEQKHVTLEREEANLEDILLSICEDEELKSQKEVEIHLSVKVTTAYIDVMLTTILLQNLINNAIKYSVEKAVLEIGTLRRDENILIQIKDHGCGISKEDQEKIFSPFYRVDKARNTEGIGLGLSIAVQIAEMHGGKIEVESEVGKGSIFTLFLPEK